MFRSLSLFLGSFFLKNLKTRSVIIAYTMCYHTYTIILEEVLITLVFDARNYDRVLYVPFFFASFFNCHVSNSVRVGRLSCVSHYLLKRSLRVRCFVLLLCKVTHYLWNFSMPPVLSRCSLSSWVFRKYT